MLPATLGQAAIDAGHMPGTMCRVSETNLFFGILGGCDDAGKMTQARELLRLLGIRRLLDAGGIADGKTRAVQELTSMLTVPASSIQEAELIQVQNDAAGVLEAFALRVVLQRG